jgi:hypothetical protein
MYKQKAIFHLPGLFRYPGLYELLLKNYIEHPETFKDNVEIGSVYDSPTCIWNGGRLVLKNQPGRSELEILEDMMRTYNIPVRFTFTNCLLEENHIYDTYGNLLLEVFNNGNNEVICNSEVLENYIREKYGNSYKYISSTTKRLGKSHSKQKEEIEKDYHLIVLDYDFNNDTRFLQGIKNKEKCEILCNAICAPRCPHREEHYKMLSQYQLDFNAPPEDWCEFGVVDSLFCSKQQKCFISPEDINDIYLPMGFNNFKLEGRTASATDLIEVILYYLIKDEYKEEVRYHLQRLLYE